MKTSTEYKTIETDPENRILELEEEVQRLTDILGAIDTAAHEYLRDGGCDEDDLKGLEAACETIIELVGDA
jgi:hypothetical protein